MKRLYLYLKDRKFDTTFATRKVAAEFMYRYIVNHPDDNLTPFDFKVTESEISPKDVTTYLRAKSVLEPSKNIEIIIDEEFEEILTKLEELLVIAKAWNKIDGFTPDVRDTEQSYAIPIFEYHHDYGLCNETKESPFNGFSLSHILSFKTIERANQFAEIFKDDFKKIFGL